jgi:peptide/nickel transport system permease protein
MTRFLIRRILLALFVMVVVTMIIFGIFFVGPGPEYVARRLAGRSATQATINLVLKRLNLTKPLYIQYWDFLENMVWHHKLPADYFHQQPVSVVLKQAFPITLSLAIGGAILWLVLGVLSGVVSAVLRGSIWDRLATVLALFFYSMPVFVLGLLLLYVFYFRLTLAGIHLFPGQGYVYFSHSPVKWFESLVLPWISLALISAATYTRLTRGSMLDVLGEDYIRTARAKGLPESRVVFRHALRAALTPIVSQFGVDVGSLLGGAILTETVFGMPGLGYTAVQAISQQDLPVVMGIVIVAAMAVIIANLVVDILYAVLDPRVRLH